MSRRGSEYDSARDREVTRARVARWRAAKRAGLPTDTRKTPLERWWTFVRRVPNGCWEWAGGRDRFGYGNFWPSTGRGVKAHRFGYELVFGEIPADREVDHLCENKSCVRPDHLESVTRQENMRRAWVGRRRRNGASV